MLVGELEKALLTRFPLDDAEDWDHVGLSVGDPAQAVTGVTCALDATEENVKRTAELGANVLLAHHPIYIKAPERFTPAGADVPQCASALYKAAQVGVSVISLHTNLDRSLAARNAVAAQFGSEPVSSLEHIDDPQATGLGSVFEIEPCTLGALASTAAEAFDSAPRIWGSPNKRCKRIAYLGGSLGSFGDVAIEAGCDAIVTGECGYHVAQDLAIRGLGVILLGHDRSEELFVKILSNECRLAGICESDIYTIVNLKQWWTHTGGEHL